MYTEDVGLLFFSLYFYFIPDIKLFFQGPILVEWVPDFQFDGPLPMRSIPRGRAYSNVLFDPSTSLIVAASSLQSTFTSFDEDGNNIWEPDGKGSFFAQSPHHNEVNAWSLLGSFLRST